MSLVDDLDDIPAAGSLTFGLDGATYELDLSVHNENALLEILLPYLEAPRPMTSPKTRPYIGPHEVGDPGRPVRGAGVGTQQRAAGLRAGRLSAATIEQYRATGN